MAKEQVLEFTATAATKADLAVKSLCDVPRSQLRALFQHGCVQINGQPVSNPGTPVEPGDTVILKYDAARKYKELPRPPKHSGAGKAFKPVFEDKHLIVVDKQPGLLTVPRYSDEKRALTVYLSKYLPPRQKIYTVHRLDRETSGLLVFAKTSEVQKKLKLQFSRHKPSRIYHAFVRGTVADESGTIRSRLATDKDLNRYSVEDDEEGQPAVTHYTVERRLDDATWLKVRLETGRRNQIRVHFAERNHPVLGDIRYLPERAAHPHWKSEYLALHAATLEFAHPISNSPLQFESPMPERMVKFLKTCTH